MKRLAVDELPDAVRVVPGRSVVLRDADAGDVFGWKRDDAEPLTAKLKDKLGRRQYRLHADGRFGLLVVLQGIDGAGKDSTIRHVFSAFNPQGCLVTSFKQPCAEDLRHDYLWRVHQHVPGRGEIGVFNRSHYEDVLVVRVDRLVPRPVWELRYGQINDFERMLRACGIHLVKIFLHISRGEQKRRFEERRDNPRKQWKFDASDLAKRRQWPQYVSAFEAMLSRCSTDHAPWYRVPADHKWMRDLIIAQILKDSLERLPLRWPQKSLTEST
jgi:PPK2 family polyphosphate:nucleotide phosphotransferase